MEPPNRSGRRRRDEKVKVLKAIRLDEAETCSSSRGAANTGGRDRRPARAGLPERAEGLSSSNTGRTRAPAQVRTGAGRGCHSISVRASDLPGAIPRSGSSSWRPPRPLRRARGAGRANRLVLHIQPTRESRFRMKANHPGPSMELTPSSSSSATSSRRDERGPGTNGCSTTAWWALHALHRADMSRSWRIAHPSWTSGRRCRRATSPTTPPAPGTGPPLTL